MKFLKHVMLVKDFSWYELVLIIAATAIAQAGHWLIWIAVLILGVLVRVVFQFAVEYQPLDKGWQAYAQAGRKLEAIKYCREARGIGLKDARDVVEEYMRRNKII